MKPLINSSEVKMKTISVVIPVYNVEKYLSECLDSVVNQTYKNLQIIIVDDGSTDSSGKICDEYAGKDNRISVIHQSNAGAGAAKNTGLELIDGDYFSIIDSDDYIELDMYEKMVNSLEKYNSDIAQCLFRNVFVNDSFDRKYKIKGNYPKILTSKNFLKEYLYDWKYAIFWNKLFKKSLLQNIKFPVGRKIDDEFFTYKLVCNAKKVVNIDNILYNYRMRKTSVMNENNSDRLIYDRIDCFIERYNYVSNVFPSLKKKYNLKLYDDLLHFKDSAKDNSKILSLLNDFSRVKYGVFDKLYQRKMYNRLVFEELNKSNKCEFE